MRAASRFVRGCPLTLAVLLASTDAGAAASAHLVYVRGPGAEQCPGESAVRGAVRERLGYDPFFPWARDTLVAEIIRADGSYRLSLKVVDAENIQRGAREIAIAGDDCSAAIDVMGLTISLTLDPSTLLGATAPAQELAPAPPPAQNEAERAPQSDLSPPRDSGASAISSRGPSFTFHAGAGLLGSVASAPSATVGATVFAGASWRLLSLDIEGRGDLPATGDAEGTPARVRSWLLVASAVPCVHLGAPYGCLVLSGGSFGATSAGVAVPREDSAPWWAAGLRGGAELPLTRALSVRAYAELLAVLTRNSLAIDHDIVLRLPPWSGGFGAALAWRFP